MTQKKLEKEAMRVLKETSRTFYIPITLLKRELKLTVGSAYLCMRAIDEIEDHEEMAPEIKADLLRQTRDLLMSENTFAKQTYETMVQPYEAELPEVTLRLADWLEICPEGIQRSVRNYTAEMADGMADWVEKDWEIHTKEDLDDYTYYVAGLVGVMLSDIWKWYDNTETDYDLAIGFGRGLQAVNILRNQHEDFAERGVRFIPDDWTREDVFAYADENLAKADAYLEDIETRNIRLFCKIPLGLAKSTLKTMLKGHEKMTRTEVETLVEEIKEEE